MSQSLNLNKVLQRLQMAIHDLHDLAASQGTTFEGIRFDEVPFVYRDAIGPTFWRITIVPEGTPEEVEESEIIEEEDQYEDEPDALEQEFKAGFDEARAAGPAT